uniref:2-hydroxyacyl-CoA lyase 2 n=1 Tax=Biomphalaria glabrata TaxID=6526 RepID=A0A2C9LFX1_BIOGL
MANFDRLGESIRNNVSQYALAVGVTAASVGLIFFLKKFGIVYNFLHKVDEKSKRHGGELVAEVLKALGIPCFLGGMSRGLLGRHSDIQVRQQRREALQEADLIILAGVTNTVTAVKNAQMAESPVLLIGGAAATLLKGRGALQDIDQISLFKPLCKFCATVTSVRDIVPTLRKALQIAQSGTPGPVFVEFPIDTLYPYQLVKKEIGMKDKGPSSLGQRIVNWYLNNHLTNLFAGAWEEQVKIPLPVDISKASKSQIQKCIELISKAKKPVILVGSQATLPPTPVEDLRKSLEVCSVCDFRLGYGRVLPRITKIIAVNRNKEQLLKNSDMFWKPTLAVQSDVASFLVSVISGLKGYKCDPDWVKLLRKRDIEKETANSSKCSEPTDVHLNPIKVLHVLEDVLSDDAILVADGGDFVATAAYILRPRGPLRWLDPGAFGTLGVGGGFALGAKLCRPESDVWIIYGDGSLGYSIVEFDTYTRHKCLVYKPTSNLQATSDPNIGTCSLAICIQLASLPTRARIGVCELQEIIIYKIMKNLFYCKYETSAEGLGGKGLRLDRTNESEMFQVLQKAVEMSRNGSSVLINVLIGKTNFREGSISV